jgi:hypothetical protein
MNGTGTEVHVALQKVRFYTEAIPSGGKQGVEWEKTFNCNVVVL